MSDVISIRVPKWVKQKLKEYGIDVAQLVRKAIMEELERLEAEALEKELNTVSRRLAGKVDPYELAEIVDEERKLR